MAVTTNNIRNVVVIAHSGAGKTMLVENLLFKGGAISKAGSVDQGTTVSDYNEDEKTRKTVLTTYQKRKQDTIRHPFLDEKTSVGLLIHLQARLLARHIRGDLDAYPPFVWK